MTKYAPMTERTELVSWFFALQWLVPTLMLVLLIPRIQKSLNRVANLRMLTVVGLVLVAVCITLYFTSMFGRWFAWSTLGLLILLMLTVANAQTERGYTSAFLLGAMVVFLSLGSWEVIYQTGLLFYYNFFGCGIMNYYVIVGEQLLWFIPALIVVLVLHQRGLRLHVSRITIACMAVSIVCTLLWFVNGMDIPLLWWQGPNGLEGPVVNEAARPLLISVSRGSQSFWLLGITTMFTRAPRLDVTVITGGRRSGMSLSAAITTTKMLKELRSVNE